MKRLGLIIIFFCLTLRLSAQPVSQYPFGLFLYEFSGITNTGVVSPYVTTMYSNLCSNLKMNYLSVNNSSQYGFPGFNPGFFIDYFQVNQPQFKSVLGFQNIPFMFSTYLSIIPKQSNDVFVLSNNFTKVWQTNNTLRVSLPQNPNNMSVLISQVKLYGAEQYEYEGGPLINQKSDGNWYNWKTLRNWWALNSLKLYIKISNSSSLGTSSEIKANLKKSNFYGTTITDLVNATRPLSDGEYLYDFTLDSTCFEIGISLTLEIKIPTGAAFTIESIKIYNDMGKDIVETGNCFSDPQYYYSNVVNRINANSNNTIFELGEELEIGNFLPTKKLVDRLIADTQSKIICSYVTNYNYIINSSFYTKFANTVGLRAQDIVETDYYPVNINSSHTQAIGTYYKLLKSKRIKDGMYTSKPFTIVQTGQDFDGGRVPTKSELNSMLYTSLLTNYKGVFLYWSGPYNYGNSYEGLYSNNCQNVISTEAPVYNYLKEISNIPQVKRDAITAFTNVVNYSINDPNIPYTNIGDILLNQVQTGNSLSGYSSQGISFNSLGNISKVQLTGVGSNNKVGVALYEMDQSTSIAIASKTKVGLRVALPTAYYYIFYNLNETEAGLNISAVFQSTNTKPSIRVTTLNSTQYPNGQIFNKNCTVPLTIPALGAVLLKVENIDQSYGAYLKKDIEKEVVTLDSYPNPFNPMTTIKFNLPETGHVTLKIFDTIGREIATLIDETRTAGVHQAVFNANNLPSGVYIYSLRTNAMVMNKKLLLLK